MKALPYTRTFVTTMVLALCLGLAAPGFAAGTPAGPAPADRGAPAGSSGQAASAAEIPAGRAPQKLSAEESAALSARAEEPGDDVTGGALSNTHLTYVVIALAAAVIVLIAK